MYKNFSEVEACKFMIFSLSNKQCFFLLSVVASLTYNIFSTNHITCFLLSLNALSYIILKTDCMYIYTYIYTMMDFIKLFALNLTYSSHQLNFEATNKVALIVII